MDKEPAKELTKEERRQFGILCGQIFKKPKEEKPVEKASKNLKLVVKHARQYGNNRYYPVNWLAKKLLEFTAYSPSSTRTTFCDDQIRIARELGFDIEIIPTPLKLGFE